MRLKNIINKLLAEKNYKEIIKNCYDYFNKNKNFNLEVLNLLVVSLINIKQFRLAKVFIEKLIELKQNDANSVKNLMKINDHLEKYKSKNDEYNNEFNYLLSLFENDSKASISLCMIVKNEEANIKKCLDSVKDIVSEIIIVDTGCTDRTIEIAKNYNAKIIPFEWINDFSAARNKSLENATGDYILFLDADEYIDKDSYEFFKNLKKPTIPHSYFVRIINFTEREADSNYFVEHYFTRIWTNNLKFRFTGKIHENLTYADNSFIPPSTFSKVTIFHTGYMKNEINRKNKLERNLQLLKAAIKEDPENSFHEYNLAIQYKNMGELDEAVKHFNLMEQKQKEKAITTYYIFGISALSATYIQMGKFKEAIEAANKALAINENFKEAIFNLGLAQYYLGDYNKAIENFTKILDDKKPEAFIGGTMDLAIRSWKTLNAVGICYIGLEDYTSAIKSLKKAYKINKFSGETILNLITAYYKINKLNEIINLLEKIKKIKYPLHVVEQILTKLYSFNLKKHAISFLENQKINYVSEKDLNDLELKFIKKADLFKANIYYDRKKYKYADIFYSKYFNNGNYDLDAMSKWGHSNLLLKNYLKAEEILEKVLNENHGNWNIYHNLGTVKMSLEKLDDAISLFKKAKELNPECIETYLNLGKIYIYKQEYLNAFETFNYAAFLDKKNKNKKIIYYLANTLYFMGNYNEALEKALFYLDINGPDAECFYLIGLTYYKIGDYINSSLYFSKAISVDNEKIDYFICLGNSLKKLKMFEDAKTYYQYALSIDESNIQAQAGYYALLLESTIKNLNKSLNNVK